MLSLQSHFDPRAQTTELTLLGPQPQMPEFPPLHDVLKEFLGEDPQQEGIIVPPEYMDYTTPEVQAEVDAFMEPYNLYPNNEDLR